MQILTYCGTCKVVTRGCKVVQKTVHESIFKGEGRKMHQSFIPLFESSPWFRRWILLLWPKKYQFVDWPEVGLCLSFPNYRDLWDFPSLLGAVFLMRPIGQLLRWAFFYFKRTMSLHVGFCLQVCNDVEHCKGSLSANNLQSQQGAEPTLSKTTTLLTLGQCFLKGL